MADQLTPELSLLEALNIIEAAWGELQLSPFVQLATGARPNRLPDLSLAEAERRAAVGRSLLCRADMISDKHLPHEIALTLRLVRFRAEAWARDADWYWMIIDPRGIGSYGMFLPTAYTGGSLLNFVHNQLASFRFSIRGDLDRYLGLVSDYARTIDQMGERTAGQALRKIHMPKVQVAQARSLLSGLKSGAREALGVSHERIDGIDGRDKFLKALDERISECVVPAFDRALTGLSDSYLAAAPDTVGIGQYPGGRAVYESLVKLHTTLDLSPEAVHELGLARIAEINAAMKSIRKEVNFEGDTIAYLAHIQSDPAWRADDSKKVKAVFDGYLDRLRPHLERYFSVLPSAPYSVHPLPTVLQDSMTYGYYDTPRSDRPEGQFLFNAKNLTRQSLFNVAALTYHELMPGHHLHFATQQENASLHSFRRHSFVNAFNEGWAEYAATLADEIGLYQTPEERYGRLVMDAFLNCRLVVDTGMNVLGWSLEEGRDYMRRNSGMTEAEILTETIRYSCDRPAQALAYKLGDVELLRMRENMQDALGPNFDIKTFHQAVLGPGALPLPDVAWHVEHVTEELKRKATS